MGAELPSAQTAHPSFLMFAQRDPAGAGIFVLQVVKGWLDGEGNAQESVTTVYESDLPEGNGQLCTTWVDQTFVPAQQALYYMRVLEVAVPRWSVHDCAAAGVDCGDPGTIGPGFAACCDGSLPDSIQERAWTSPIWTRQASGP